MVRRPPKWPLKFLRWYCKEEYLDEIEGDLVEMYHRRSKASPRFSRLFFVWNVLRSFRWINLKLIGSSSPIYLTYLKVGFRSIRKDWKFSVLNFFGLSMGLSIFTIMLLMVQHEYSFDSFHEKGDRIFEVIQEFERPEGLDPEVFTSFHLAGALREELPSVENAVTVHTASDTWVEAGGKRFFEEEGIVAGKQFFDIFDFELKQGSKSKVLQEARSIVLDEDLAVKYFGLEDPIGQVVELDRYGLFTVTGILKSVPSNSYIQFNFIITQEYDVFFDRVASWFPGWFMSWEGHPVATYVLLKDAEMAPSFSDEVQAILGKHLTEEQINRHYLIGLLDLHFGSNEIDGSINRFVKGDIGQVGLFAGIAFLILIMACLNYVNITTSRSIRRSREVGIRKSIGAFRTQLIGQFLSESFLMVILASVLSTVLILLFLPYFNLIIGVTVDLSVKSILHLLPGFVATVFLVTILAGFYPAFYLTRFSTIQVLNSSTFSVRGNSGLRNTLVTVQYILVMLMLASLLVVNKQYTFFSSKSLGFNEEQLLVVEINGGGVRDNYLNLKNELLANPEITNVTGLTRMIGGYRSSVSVNASDLDTPDQLHALRYYGMDEDGIATLGLRLKHGSPPTGNERIDSASVYLNETAAKLYGSEQIIGQMIRVVDDEGANESRLKVAGIIEDFHYSSLHEPIGPVIIGYYINVYQGLDDIVIKMRGNDVLSTLTFVEDVHNKFDENDVMTWAFADDMIQRSYEREMMFRSVFTGASVLSLVIAILGMVGLISYNAIARTKEFGIRKVFGASFWEILRLQSKSFVGFILLASAISFPVVWWLAQQWLDNYAFRIKLTIFPFVGIMLLILTLTCLIVYLISYKIARENPVNAIRYE